jgi:quinol---cytochrome c reductase iron-sulfur subunit, bacillus type
MSSSPADLHPEDVRRRRFLSRAFAVIQTAIGATVAFVMGGAVIGPAFGAKRANWWPAATLADLVDGEPTPVTIRRAQTDGYRQTVNREVVFLIKTSDKVTALSSTCTHLGCRVAWDAEAALLKCPCHGGTFDRHGVVKSGPPPAPLAALATRIEGGQVMVEL